MNNNYHMHLAWSGSGLYRPAVPWRSALSICSSVDCYTWTDLEEELDLLPPPPEWMLAPAAA